MKTIGQMPKTVPNIINNTLRQESSYCFLHYAHSFHQMLTFLWEIAFFANRQIQNFVLKRGKNGFLDPKDCGQSFF